MPRSARCTVSTCTVSRRPSRRSWARAPRLTARSEEHTSELQSQSNLVCRLLLEQKNLSRPPQRPVTSPAQRLTRSRTQPFHARKQTKFPTTLSLQTRIDPDRQHTIHLPPLYTE